MGNGTAAVYIRVGSPGIDQISVNMQKEYLRAFAKERGFDNLVFYDDSGYSGLNLNRPALSELTADLQSGKIKTVIARNESRIARDYLLFGKWLDSAREAGVTVLFSDNPNGNPLTDIRADIMDMFYKQCKRKRA